jgi:tetratricopeptide (TPR) repeat protein
MLAFSRRILAGGDLTREMVYALESLVRHHGPMKQSTKALGVGYAALGEYRKALEFLVQAEQEALEDREVKAALLQAYLGAGQFEDAVKAGRMLVNTWGSAVSDDTVAAFALALLNLGRIDDAQALLGSYPGLDPRNPLVKQAKKLLRRVNGSDIWSFLEELTPLHRLFRKAENARSYPAAVPDDLDELSPFADAEPPRPMAARPAPQPEPPQEHIPAPPRPIVKRLKATLEYWIYVPGPSAPKREAIRHRLAELQPAPEARDRVLRMLDTFMDRKELSVDYIFRRDAEELFNYPGEIIPKNSRKLSKDDLNALNAAAMVLRMRLVTADVATLDYLDFMVRYVEAARDLTGGVIQDAISHTLWGSGEWKSKMPANHLSRVIESHVQWDALDESGVVWLHSHGMQKFGVPETEL